MEKQRIGVKLYQKGKGKPKQESYFSKEKIFESNIKEDGTYRKYITGKDIDSYYYNWNNTWVKYGKNLAEPRYPELFEGSKILVRRIVGQRLISSLIEEDLVTSQLLQIVKLNDDKLNKSSKNVSHRVWFYHNNHDSKQPLFFPIFC